MEQQTIPNLEQKIRDFINEPRAKHNLLHDRAEWNKLCSSLDVIGDTEIALDAYLNTPKSKNDGENYLAVYGALQVLFVQQDAVTHLAEALQVKYTPDPLLDRIRDIRNNSIGHPTKRGGGKGKAFNYISRHSLSRFGFELMTTYPDKEREFIDIDIPQLITSQRVILAKTLAEVIEILTEKEMKHRRKYRHNKLVDAFPKTLGYGYEKIHEAIEGRFPAELGESFVQHILDTIEHFKNMLNERGALGAYDDSIAYYSQLLEYPLNKLHIHFNSPIESKLNDKDAYIFLFFIRKHMGILTQLAEEIDDDYATDL